MASSKQYKKLTPIQHILERPGMYIGSVKKTKEISFVSEKNEEDEYNILSKLVDYSPGFLKIFDEILTNATDHSFRDTTLNYIKVFFNHPEKDMITVVNNGEGIPVEIHKDYNIYIPELIFGNLLTGSNYDDNVQRRGAGTNGLGSKCISKDTQLYLFDGRLKKAIDINIGDVLIGDDGTPRNILNKIVDDGEMFSVSQQYGETYKVNSEHILTLLYRNTITIDISVKDYILLDDKIKNNFTGKRANPTIWNSNVNLSVDPFLYGLKFASGNIDVNKLDYLFCSVNDRMLFFSGIVNVIYKFFPLIYNIVCIPSSLNITNDFLFLCTHLGFYVKPGPVVDTFRIYGDFTSILDILPSTFKNFPLYSISTGKISITDSVPDTYVGFHLDGNKRFTLSDGTVTHNCTNIYSKKFIVETVDNNRKKKYVQVFENNMSVVNKPKITSFSGKSYTSISFLPDYSKFFMNGLESDTLLLLQKRVIDCISVTNSDVSIYLDSKKLKGKTLEDYVKNYYTEKKNIIAYESQKNWEYLVTTTFDKNTIGHVSFVNGNYTSQGGKHVDYIFAQITNKLKKLLEEKKKIKDIKISSIKDKLFLFLNSSIVNPTFNSQTKECLVTPSKEFGTSITVSDSFIEKIYKSSIVEEILEIYKIKESIELSKKTDGKKTSKVFIPKLEDALWAGSPKSRECTLILTEGDSAKTFAMWGRSIVGPERYAIFPLRGKCIWENTKVLLWNGEIKLAKHLTKDDILIGDDGTKRHIVNLSKNSGKMYEINQIRGDSYRVNENHILTLCLPQHKRIIWVKSSNSWASYYWDAKERQIKIKHMTVSLKLKCKECLDDITLKCMRIHYKRKHSDKIYKPYTLSVNKSSPDILEKRKQLETFLSNIDDNNIFDISIKDFMCLPKSFQKRLKGVRNSCIQWDKKDVSLDPYILGLWLGDGCKTGYAYACHGKLDTEIIAYLEKWGNDNDAKFTQINNQKYSYSISSIDNFKKQAPLKKLLDKYNLVNNKHIPKEYLINSKEIRLQLLAGIIDTDGYIYQDGTIEICQTTKHQKLIDDIIYLVRSLGFYCHVSTKKTNYIYKKTDILALAVRLKISGNISDIPTLLPRKKPINTSKYINKNITGFITIKEIGIDNYVGLNLDGNHRFLINDFTVTHNCLNVRDASISQIINNEEINNLKKIIGLKQDIIYTSKNIDNLRYGKVMLLVDQDLDGSHIKSLLVNFFHFWWPSLLKLDYIQTLQTPILKAIKGKTVLEFFTEGEYAKWKEVIGSKLDTYNIRYFKGLGTSTKEDAKNTFKRLADLKVDYYYQDSKCDEAILLAFNKDKNTAKNTEKCSDKRKEWLRNYNKDVYIDTKQDRVSFQDLINKELIHFSIYDNLRSIPSLCDGLKPSQRKILFYMLKKNKTDLIKVAQLSGYVSAETNYHHGEASLQGAIIGMAQDFIGTNNINLLTPSGNFGSRISMGKDAASPRYIYTKLSPITPIIFNNNDSILLNYLNDDGTQIEPEWFLPIIPMVLINGCEGIGTGYSTFIPTYNPKDIVQNLLKMLIGDSKLKELIPYYKNFGGIVEVIDEKSFVTKGKWSRISNTTVEITEIPICIGVTPYKEFLESFMDTDSKIKTKKDFEVKDIQNRTKDENSEISFLVEFKKKEDLDILIDTNTFEKEFKLIKSFSTNNMYLFNEHCILTKYLSPLDILKEFYKLRLHYYSLRKNYLLKKLKDELEVLDNKIRFIREYISGKLDINNKSKQVIFQLLITKKYLKLDDSYDYLLNMPLYSLTSERLLDLSERQQKKKDELDFVNSKTDKQLWQIDLEILSKFL